MLCVHIHALSLLLSLTGFNEMVTCGWQTLSQFSPIVFPWDRTTTLHKHICSTYSLSQAGSSSGYWWYLTLQRLIFQVSTSGKSIKSMLFIDLIEQRQSLPCISLTNSSRNYKQQLPHGPVYYALYGVHFSGQALCQVVKAALMEGVWLWSPSGCIMSSEPDTGLLIEACHIIRHTAKWEQNKLQPCHFFLEYLIL